MSSQFTRHSPASSSEPSAPSASVRRLSLLVALLLIGLVLVVWCYVQFEEVLQVRPQRERWAVEIASMRAAGEPLVAADLVQELKPGALELLAWLERVPEGADDCIRGAVLTGTTASTPLSPNDVVEAFRKAQGLVSEPEFGQSLLTGESEHEEILTAWQSPGKPCQDLLDVVQQLDSVGGLDLCRWYEQIKPSTAHASVEFTRLSDVGAVLLLELLSAEVAADQAKLQVSFLRLLHLVVETSRLPTLVGAAIGAHCSADLIPAARAILPRLSLDQLREEVEPALARIAPRSALQLAVQTELIHSLHWIAWISMGASPDFVLDLENLQAIGQDADRSLLEQALQSLEYGRAIAAAVRQPYAAGQIELAKITAQINGVGTNPGYFSWSEQCWNGGSLAHVESSYLEACQLEHELNLLRLWLCLNVGDADVQAWAARTPDPFDGAPMRLRILDSGDIWVWSVGQNGVDETSARTGAQPGGDDLGQLFPAQK